jgi:hypothetical protein
MAEADREISPRLASPVRDSADMLAAVTRDRRGFSPLWVGGFFDLFLGYRVWEKWYLYKFLTLVHMGH